jgi:hypothetical protein
LLGRRAADVVAALSPRAPWLIKDPRMCLLLPLWKPVLGGPACLIVARNPAGVADSLNRRDGMPPEVGAALWELYMTRALENSAGMRRVIVSFDKMLLNPAAAASAVHADLAAAGCVGAKAPDGAGITACFGPRPAAGAAGQRVVGLTSEQQCLWDKLNGGEAPAPVPPVSPRALQILRSHEKVVVAAMPPRERAKRRLRGLAGFLGLPWACRRRTNGAAAG